MSKCRDPRTKQFVRCAPGRRAATYRRTEVDGPLTRQSRKWHDRDWGGGEAFNAANVIKRLKGSPLSVIYKNLKIAKLGRHGALDEYGESKPGVRITAGSRTGYGADWTGSVTVIPGIHKRRSIVGEKRSAGYQVGVEKWDSDPGYPGGGDYGEVIFVPFGNPVALWELHRMVGLALAEAAFGPGLR